jgi:hypothetical protein
MKISKQDLVNILVKASATVESVEVQTYSVAKMNKRNNPLKDERVNKLQTIEYAYGKSYEQRVNEALEENGKEGTFKSKKLPWGEWLEGAEGSVIAHTKNGEDKLYIRCYLKKGVDPKTEYYVNGKPATEEEVATIKEFTPSRTKDSSTQSEAGLEQEQQVVVNAVDFDNIITITIDGVTYELNDLKL